MPGLLDLRLGLGSGAGEVVGFWVGVRGRVTFGVGIRGRDRVGVK